MKCNISNNRIRRDLTICCIVFFFISVAPLIGVIRDYTSFEDHNHALTQGGQKLKISMNGIASSVACSNEGPVLSSIVISNGPSCTIYVRQDNP